MRDMAAACVGLIVGAAFVAMLWVGSSDLKKYEERSRTDILIEFQQKRIDQMAEGLVQAERGLLVCQGYSEVDDDE